MAFSSIPASLIQVGKAITKNLWTLTKDNLDDLNSRVNSVETNQSRIKVFDGRLFNSSPATSLSIIQTFQAQSDFNLTNAVIKLLGQDLTGLSGDVEIDIVKGTADFDFTTANSVFITRPLIDLSIAGIYDVSTNATFDTNQTNISTGDVLALKFTELPSGGILSQIAFDVYGES